MLNHLLFQKPNNISLHQFNLQPVIAGLDAFPPAANILSPDEAVHPCLPLAANAILALICSMTYLSFSDPQNPPILLIAASPDFLKWIRKESRNGRFDLIHPDTTEELRSMLMGVEYGDLTSPPQFPAFSGKLGGIRKAWIRPDTTDEEREDVKKELFKEAFGVAGPKDTKNDYWCFCKNEWKQTILWEYCTKCDECRDTRERHCEECGNRNIRKGCECQKGAKRRKLHQGATCAVVISQ
ncbi:hypothetical protein BCON_0118g00030 [Botryotinia convoluta]|uniref:Uncharacterized protein n=1 Tax=Botryotinia convoluta TaxID=54673 RepID=A0A4Z1I4R7_9HELO|nr:hypothetical protein BCON_0118g00030 [Botryotinia convoluta]